MAAPTSEALQHLFRQGRAVGELARKLFGGGHQVRTVRFSDAARRTQEALQAGVQTLFEGAFIVDGLGIRVDVLQYEPERGDWDLIEVKMSTKVKEEHLVDLAFQRYVLEEAGLVIGRTVLMHVNRRCCYPDLRNFFTEVDLTETVAALLGGVADKRTYFESLLEQEAEPTMDIGQHCNKPYDCPFQAYCWQHVPRHSVFTIPRIKKDRAAGWFAAGIETVHDLPGGEHLSPTQRAYVDIVRAGSPRFNVAGIQEKLARLQYPILFLDFETDNPAIPRFDGMHPYDMFPFQFSLHTLSHDGRLQHTGYLHGDESDPREVLALRLIQAVGRDGSIVVYNAGFEKGVLRRLGEALPELAPALEAISHRIWDLLDVIRQDTDHPDYEGSKSIKRVLPALVPGFTYDDLDVGDGGAAQAIWNTMIRAGELEKNRRSDQLEAYCALDTEAMVRIYQELLRIAYQIPVGAAA